MSVVKDVLQEPATVFAKRVELMGTEAAFGFGSRIVEVEQQGERVIRANLGQPDFPLPAHIVEAVIAAIRDGQTTYCDPQGLPELRPTATSTRSIRNGSSFIRERDRPSVLHNSRTASRVTRSFIRPRVIRCTNPISLTSGPNPCPSISGKTTAFR